MEELKSDIFLWARKHGLTSVSRLAKAYINQLRADTGCCLEDLQKRDGQRGQLARKVHVVSIL